MDITLCFKGGDQRFIKLFKNNAETMAYIQGYLYSTFLKSKV